MRPASVPADVASEGIRASIWTSPDDGSLINRNWSEPPVSAKPAPPAITVHTPPETLSDPAGDGLPMSWQVAPDGQLGSGGGEPGSGPGRPKAQMAPAGLPVM